MADGKKNILVIDDVSTHLMAVKTVLKENYNVRLARSGELAKSILSSVAIDLILLDIEMPGLSGFEYMEWLKDNPATKHIPVIFISSHTQPEVVQYAARFNIEGYIKKPVDPALLRERVRHVFLKK